MQLEPLTYAYKGKMATNITAMEKYFRNLTISFFLPISVLINELWV